VETVAAAVAAKVTEAVARVEAVTEVEAAAVAAEGVVHQDRSSVWQAEATADAEETLEACSARIPSTRATTWTRCRYP